ncbi:EAL domain-containing protein [Psychrosphaera ytuae]|uniref:EAL domain-containing protein n=1 Tax=Psychrosphaera ytuae TaxID=2820710 RepID=A0A975DAC0_9GAMM|nr:EAL domain-containing response regulator [Psychrosphaera ytuae]QTH63273.1 EAL domain-containing protein [Psychrosphaera ytuae]
MNLLLVEDDIFDQEQIYRAFSNRPDWNIDTVASLKEATAFAKNQFFDLVLLDLNLPDGSGLDIIPILLANLKTPNSALIVMTNVENDELAEQCLEMGAHDFLVKSEVNCSKILRAVMLAKKRAQLESQLKSFYETKKKLSETDLLTQVKNRYFLDNYIENELNKDRNSMISLLLIDIKSFKQINDSYGAKIGNKVLIILGQLISKTIKPVQTVSRLGSDTFAVVCTGACCELTNIETADLINDQTKQKLVIDNFDGNLHISLNFGVATSNFSVNSEQLLRNAELALSKAKHNYSDNFFIYESSMEESLKAEKELEDAIRYNLEHKTFDVAYQPLFDKEDTVVGFETLVRWPSQSPIHSTPDVFIPIAEKTGLIQPLGLWIFEKALKQRIALKQNGYCDLYFSVNVSPCQFTDPLLCDRLSKLCYEYDCPTREIIIEITETSLLTKSSHIESLHNAGFTIALDDFGTGFSSISHLINHPIDMIKLDKSVLPCNEDDAKKLHIMRSISSLCRSLKIDSVCEGVETEWQKLLVHSLGINKAQGYLMSKPIHSRALIRTLTSDQFNLPQTKVTNGIAI